jgi:hypothetical protein
LREKQREDRQKESQRQKNWVKYPAYNKGQNIKREKKLQASKKAGKTKKRKTSEGRSG